jgi:hypothetical protein
MICSFKKTKKILKPLLIIRITHQPAILGRFKASQNLIATFIKNFFLRNIACCIIRFTESKKPV